MDSQQDVSDASASSAVQTPPKEDTILNPNADEHSTAGNPNEVVEPENYPPAPKRRMLTRALARHDTQDSSTSSCTTKKKETVTSNTYNADVARRWFRHYVDRKHGNVITPSGIKLFVSDLGKELSDINMVVLSWLMDSRDMGIYTEQEWMRGMSFLRVDCVSQLVNKWDELTKILDDPDNFKAIYRFSYDFSRDKEYRHLDMEHSIALINAFLTDRWSLCKKFLEFLGQSDLKTMNKDQYNNILEFQRNVSNDLSNYDMEGAWPVLMDDFVAWYHAQEVKSTDEEIKSDKSS